MFFGTSSVVFCKMKSDERYNSRYDKLSIITIHDMSVCTCPGLWVCLFVCLFVCLVGWFLVGWLVGWLNGWLNGWLEVSEVVQKAITQVGYGERNC